MPGNIFVAVFWGYAPGYFTITVRESPIEGFVGSFVLISTVFVSRPDFPVVSTAKLILPVSPGLRRLELAITAEQPQEAVSFSITSS